MFKMWKTMVEKEIIHPIKAMKFDNSGKYMSKEFAEYLSQEDIRRLKTIPRTSQENDVAKMINITLL